METVLRRLKITNPCCPYCQRPVTIYEKRLQCCGLTAEAVLIIQPPPVESVRGIDKDLSNSHLIIDPNAIQPAFAVDKEARIQSRKSWIGYLPQTGNIRYEVFRCFVEHQIPLPMCPRCRQPLEFRKDVSETEKPFCSEKTCQAFFSPAHFPQGTVGQWRSIYEKPFPLETDEFRLNPKSFESTHVENNELRSLGLDEYWQHAAMFAATSVSETADSDPDTIKTLPSPDSDRLQDDRLTPKSETEVQETSPPHLDADASPQPEKIDSCAEFIQTLICKDPTAFITRKEIYTRYKNWCQKNYKDCEKRNVLYRQIRQIKNVKPDRKRPDGKKLERGFTGIRIL